MQDSLLPRVQRAFHSAFDIDPRSITIDTQPDDVPRWDSLGHATLAFSLEQEFKFRFDIDELMELENVREIVRVVRRKLDAVAAGAPRAS
ncbi:MAG: acyl carrier protein [Gammaproteobacteria bacterium]|nr:acyl carrier protein [Gammaproteobacteria bacterium]